MGLTQVDHFQPGCKVARPKDTPPIVTSSNVPLSKVRTSSASDMLRFCISAITNTPLHHDQPNTIRPAEIVQLRHDRGQGQRHYLTQHLTLLYIMAASQLPEIGVGALHNAPAH